MFICGMQVNTEVFYKLTLWVCIVRLAQSIQNKNFAYLSISRKAWLMKLLFCLQVKTKVFYKFIVSLWVWKARHPKVPKITNLRSFQYLKENVKDDVDFLLADKH